MPDVASERIRIVPHGVSDEFTAEPDRGDAEVLRRLGLPGAYVLYVGTVEPRKNLARLVEAYRRLLAAARPIDPDLVIVGRLGWQYDELLRQIAAPELQDRVHLAGYVARSDLPALYRGAAVFVYPSLEEGFGLPPLEAMACGTPTIASRTSALGEYLDGAARLVDPEDEAALAEAMGAVLADAGERHRLRTLGLGRARSFRWETAARETLYGYEALGAPERRAVLSSARPDHPS